jgi:hypothetical protein
LKWTFNSTGGTSVVHDEVGLDNISITASIPEPSAFLFVGMVAGLTGLAVVKRWVGRTKVRVRE